jgi:hypothetical protein
MKEIKECQKMLEYQLKRLEDGIFAAEGKYLEDYAHSGNIVRGWDGFLSKPIKPLIINSSQRKAKFYPSERIFSDSSMSSPSRRQEALQEIPKLKRKNPILVAKPNADRVRNTKKHKIKRCKQKTKKVRVNGEESAENYGQPNQEFEGNEFSSFESNPNPYLSAIPFNQTALSIDFY